MQRARPKAAGASRYSARHMEKPVNFVCRAADAKQVYVSGDFNSWHPTSHPMQKQKDGSWFLSVPLHHGHHHYVFLADGQQMLDPLAMGIARNERNERVSLIAVS